MVLVARLPELNDVQHWTLPSDGAHGIDIDHRAAAHDMTEHLLGLGHQRIGFIGGPADVSTAVQRESGFRSAMSAAGLQPTLVARGDFTYTGGFEAATRLLSKEPPTAIFAANDQMALGALNAALTAGVHVPDDLPWLVSVTPAPPSTRGRR